MPAAYSVYAFGVRKVHAAETEPRPCVISDWVTRSRPRAKVSP
jgi:hypothetical protein